MMGVVLVRVDSRLIHGQILEAWIPHTRADALLVVDDEVSKDLLRRSVMEMAIPSNINVEFDTIDEAVNWYKNGGYDEKRTIVLFSKLNDAKKAFDMGFSFNTLNLGNIHFCEGKIQVISNLCLDRDDSECIVELTKKGVSIDSRSVPVEKKVDFTRLLDAVENKCKIKETKRE